MAKISDFKYFVDYEWIKTKQRKEPVNHDLFTVAGRRIYFDEKVGEEIKLLKKYFKDNSFVAYLMAPKMAGKGTYTKMLEEVIGKGYFETVSVGDVVREAEKEYTEQGENSEVYQYVKKHYRGFLSLEEAFESMARRSTATVMPTEFVLTLVKRKIDKSEGKTLFIDGFPRKVDQVSYSLYFRDLINHREDQDIFILINIPIAIIDARIKNRRICPKCQSSRNTTLFPTSDVRVDEKGEIYMMCDNPECEPVRLVAKEGDEQGIGLIEDRIISDLELMELARKMYGIERIELYNALEKEKAFDYVDEYEITKETSYKVVGKELKKEEKLLVVIDDDREYYSLYPAPVVVQLIRQLVKVLGLK